MPRARTNRMAGDDGSPAETTGWWISGLTADDVEARCSPEANLRHVRMIQRRAIAMRKEVRPDGTMVRYWYRYVSPREPDPPTYTINIVVCGGKDVAAGCTCPSHARSTTGTGGVWEGTTWCKHVVALSLLLVDPATRVRLPKIC